MTVLLALLACEPPAATVPRGTAGETGETGETARPEPSAPGFAEDLVLVVPNADGLSLYAHDGTLAGSASWSALVGSCEACGGEGASADGDGLLLSFTAGPGTQGDVARLDGAGALDFRLGGFDFPHDVARDPADGTLLVPEPTADRVRWVAGDGSSPTALRQLDAGDAGWPGLLPNGVERFDHAGRSWLLVSHRGTETGGPSPSGGRPDGEITLWDITTARAPMLRWRFPSEGALDTPHGAVLRLHGGRWWLLWAHTEGAALGGSVGLAVTADPTVRPEYVADLVPADPFAYLRGVDLTAEGWLVLTDSGALAGGGADGRIVQAPFPADLVPTGASGAVDEDQVVLELTGAAVFADGIGRPFEGWLWTPTFSL